MNLVTKRGCQTMATHDKIELFVWEKDTETEVLEKCHISLIASKQPLLSVFMKKLFTSLLKQPLNYKKIIIQYKTDLK